MNKLMIIMASLAALVGLFMISDSAARAADQPIIGDADCSGQINSRDGVLVMRAAVGRPVQGADSEKAAECLSLGDTDCDGSLDSADAMRILRFAVGKSLPSVGNCVIGQSVPDFEEGRDVLSEEPLFDDGGRQIATVVVVGETAVASGVSLAPNAVTALAADYYWSCMSEVYAKNAVGMKVWTLRHYQPWRYDGSRVTVMYTPYMTSSTGPGWSMHDPVTSGPNNYGWVGTSSSSATFKYMNMPWVGSLQSYRVTAGTYVYGNGSCYRWAAW